MTNASSSSEGLRACRSPVFKTIVPSFQQNAFGVRLSASTTRRGPRPALPGPMTASKDSPMRCTRSVSLLLPGRDDDPPARTNVSHAPIFMLASPRVCSRLDPEKGLRAFASKRVVVNQLFRVERGTQCLHVHSFSHEVCAKLPMCPYIRSKGVPHASHGLDQALMIRVLSLSVSSWASSWPILTCEL